MNPYAPPQPLPDDPGEQSAGSPTTHRQPRSVSGAIVILTLPLSIVVCVAVVLGSLRMALAAMAAVPLIVLLFRRRR
ncbi:MAG: hypothetical protein AAF958_17325 [Planctomycetota bacterium]